MFVISAISWYMHINFSKDNHEDERPNADDIHQSQGSLSFIIISSTIFSRPFFQRRILLLPRTMLWHLHFFFYLHEQYTWSRDLTSECKWLEEVKLTANYDGNAYVTWSVNHAAQKRGLDFPINALSQLLKFLQEEAPILLLLWDM
jgi:hypothetical protein